MPSDEEERAARQARLSKALSAAYLSHQITQLEDRVQSTHIRDNNHHNGNRQRSRKPNNNNKSKQPSKTTSTTSTTTATTPAPKPTVHIQPDPLLHLHRESAGSVDRLVVDASAWLAELPTLKSMIKRGGVEVVVPLETLRTLDLLKKGMHPVAIAARAAARYIESAQRQNRGLRIQREEETSEGSTVTVGPSFVQATLRCAIYFRNEWDVPSGKPVLAIAIRDIPKHDSGGGDSAAAAAAAAADTALITRHADRITGALVREWAERADVDVRVLDDGELQQQQQNQQEDEELENARLASLEDDPRAELVVMRGGGRGRGRGRGGGGGGSGPGGQGRGAGGRGGRGGAGGGGYRGDHGRGHGHGHGRGHLRPLQPPPVKPATTTAPLTAEALERSQAALAATDGINKVSLLQRPR